jgi:hypothetical protein
MTTNPINSFRSGKASNKYMGTSKSMLESRKFGNSPAAEKFFS